MLGAYESQKTINRIQESERIRQLEFSHAELTKQVEHLENFLKNSIQDLKTALLALEKRVT